MKKNKPVPSKEVVPEKAEVKPEARSLSTIKGLWQFGQKNWIYFAIIGSLAFLVYANALNAGLVSDDKGLQTEGDKMLTFEFIFVQHGGPLGFLRYLIYAFIYAIGGVAPILFRLSNVLFHVGNVGLLFIIITLLANKRLAFFAASLFAVHPILIESVTWISGGGYAQYSFFFLVSFVLYLLHDRSKKKNYYYFSVASFALALFSFNRAMTLAPIFFLYEIAFGDIKKHWKRTLPYLGLSIIWVVVYALQVGGRVAEVTKGANVETWTYSPFFQIPYSISSYLHLIAWPDLLSFYHSNIDTKPGEMFFRWLALLVLLGGIIWGYFKNRLVFFFLSFFIVSLLIYLVPLQIAWLVAERYVYLGSAGIFVVASMAFVYFMKYKKARTAIYIVFFLIVGLYAARTVVRNIDWRDEDALMVATLRTNPENAKVHNHIGTIHGREGNYIEAMKSFETARKLDPNLAETYHNMGNAFDEQARNLLKSTEATSSATVKKQADDYFNTAIPLYEKALSLDPNHWLSYQQLANIYFDKGDYQKTADYIIKMLPLNPNPQLLNNLGFVYLQMGDKVKAKQAFSEALRANPNDATAAQALQQIDNPAPQQTTPQTQTTDPALPGGQLPPEVLKAIQEQTNKSSSAPTP